MRRQRRQGIAAGTPGIGGRKRPRGQLELRVNQELPDPTRRILTCCELGFAHAVALDGGMKA